MTNPPRADGLLTAAERPDVEDLAQHVDGTRHECPLPVSTVAVRWLMRIMTPTCGWRYLSSNETPSPQRKSPREGMLCSDAAHPEAVAGGLAGSGGSTAA